jgi:hypothetical protein
MLYVTSAAHEHTLLFPPQCHIEITYTAFNLAVPMSDVTYKREVERKKKMLVASFRAEHTI